MARTLILLSCIWTLCAEASEFETIGLDQLRVMAPWLNGSGVVVAQPEVEAPGWQVNPSSVTQPQSLFTWVGGAGTATAFPNSVGGESWHANNVAVPFFGLTNGIAPAVGHVYSYDANYFFNSLIVPRVAIPARVVNQSFIFAMEEPGVDQDYDNYAARHGTLFVSGAGNGGPLSSPATAYNGIAVGAYGGASSAGPTAGGRSKPDISAPSSLTSYSTPQVAGAAALLLQSAARNDGGPGTAVVATNAITLKALLLNGAAKPPSWTNGITAPLDARYGAGVLHIGNSYRQLRGGRHFPAVIQSVLVGAPHPPATNTNNLPTRRGWDSHALSSTITHNSVAHYFVDLTTASGRTLTATLTWNRRLNQAGIGNLDLFLYNATSGALVASSESAVDNVEHLSVTNLPAARYNLQVLKQGGAVSSDTYALAFEFGPVAAPLFTYSQLEGGNFQTIVSGEPGQTYAIDSSSDMTTWTPVLTNKTSGLGAFPFSHPEASPALLFRLREVW